MPELPEVETLRRQLCQAVLGFRVVQSTVFDPKLEGISFRPGSRLRNIERHGKWLTMQFEDGSAYRIHLRMTGRLFLCRQISPPAHSRLMIELARGRQTVRLFLIDPRRFATVQMIGPGQIPPGTDAFPEICPENLHEAAVRRNVSVKSFLLDQKTIAGIGNIYACEILHAAKIDPLRKARQLSRREWRRVAECAPAILETAIDCRGTSVSDWRDLHGEKGEFQHRLKVYRREGAVCGRCGGRIGRIRQEGRSTFYCPGCQKSIK